MKIVLLTGSHLRHAYMARCVSKIGALAGVIVEDRGNAEPSPPDGLPENTARLFVRHFADRTRAERFFFEGPSINDLGCPSLVVGGPEINSRNVHEFLRRIVPDLVISYGCGILSAETLSCAKEFWNIHGGLAPWYRGAITHFWPSYLLEPQKTGMTLHVTTAELDAGEVIATTLAPMVRGDGIHDLSCRAVLSLGDSLSEILASPAQRKRHKTSGRIWRSRDWRPAHLHVIYDEFDNRIVDLYLDGHLGP